MASPPTRIIEIPPIQKPDPAPTARSNAQLFIGAYTVLVLVGTILLSLPWMTESGAATHPVDAFFTSVSASSVTGMSVVDTQDHWNLAGEITILVLIQIGCLGFTVGAAFVLAAIGRGISLRDSLIMREGSPMHSIQEATVLTGRIVRYVFACEAIGAILLTVAFLRTNDPHIAVWKGLYTAIAVFSNAGFDLEGGGRSLSGYVDSWWVNLTVIGLIQTGTLSWLVFSDIAAKRRWSRFSLDTKLILMPHIILMIGGAVMFLVLEWHNVLAHLPWDTKALAALLQSNSMRSAGVTTISVPDEHPATMFLSVAIMLVGGAAGSTAGGIKLATLSIVVIAVISTIRGQEEPQAFQRRIPTRFVYRAMTVVALFGLAHFALSLALAISEDVIAGQQFGFIAVMFETMSALCTVGLSSGITGDLSYPGKLIICLAMYVGRLGPLTVVYALQARQKPIRYRYPESQIRIG